MTIHFWEVKKKTPRKNKIQIIFLIILKKFLIIIILIGYLIPSEIKGFNLKK